MLMLFFFAFSSAFFFFFCCCFVLFVCLFLFLYKHQNNQTIMKKTFAHLFILFLFFNNTQIELIILLAYC